jgi:hypothetical protein
MSSEDKKMAQAEKEKDKAVAARKEAQAKFDAVFDLPDDTKRFTEKKKAAEDALTKADKEVEKWDNELIALIRSSAGTGAGGAGKSKCTALCSVRRYRPWSALPVHKRLSCSLICLAPTIHPRLELTSGRYSNLSEGGIEVKGINVRGFACLILAVPVDALAAMVESLLEVAGAKGQGTFYCSISLFVVGVPPQRWSCAIASLPVASLADSSVANGNPHLLRLVLNEQAAVLQAAAERLEELGKAAGGDAKASSWNARASKLRQHAEEHRELEGEQLHRCPTWCSRSLFRRISQTNLASMKPSVSLPALVLLPRNSVCSLAARPARRTAR